MDFYSTIIKIRTTLINTSSNIEIGKAVELCNQMLDYMDKAGGVLVVDKEEANHLMNYFMTCGYISPEDHEPTHKFIKKLEGFLK